jgi:hypothetical protein
MGCSVDKHFKIDEPFGTVYSSTEPKTGKVTAVVTVIKILVKKDAIHGALDPGMRSLLFKRWKEPIFWRKFPVDREPFLSK